MGILDTFRSARRRDRHTGESAAPADPGRQTKSVDTELVIEAARLVVTTRLATKTLIMRHLSVTGVTAERLLRRLEHCEIIAPTAAGHSYRVLTTSGQLPGVVEEFTRRDGQDEGRSEA